LAPQDAGHACNRDVEMAVREEKYRWLLVVALAAMVNVAYGAIFYSFGVLLGEGAAASEFGRTTLSGALGLGVLVSGMLALLAGTVCDVAGPRRVFLVGAVLGCLGLTAFSRATEAWQVIVIWTLLLGPAMACTFYEPAYVAIDQWFEGHQGKPLGVLTLVAGSSVTIFLPLTQWLVTKMGWRDATLSLGLVLLAVVGSLALLVVRDRPNEEARAEGFELRGYYRSMLAALRNTDLTFWLISAAFFLGLTAMWGMLLHQVSYLQDLGFPPGKVATVVGIIGIVSLPARLFLPALSDYLHPSLITAAIFGLLAFSGLSVFEVESWWRVYLYVGLFGAAFGSVLPMRAVLMSRHFGGAFYGRMMGLQQTMLAIATAGGPFMAGALREATGSYATPWLAAVAMLVATIPIIMLVGENRQSERQRRSA
jgi:cyanate permease